MSFEPIQSYRVTAGEIVVFSASEGFSAESESLRRLANNLIHGLVMTRRPGSVDRAIKLS